MPNERAPAEGLARFYLIVPPGLESAAARELLAWGLPAGSVESARRDRGGLEIELPIGVGLSLPRRLKIPARVLMRVADFGCRDFPKLFKKSRGLPWAEWLRPEDRLEFEASSHRSRLRIKKRIAETAAEGAAASRRSAAPAAKPASGEPFRSWIRFADDVCEISLDLSGELQHRRGERTRVGAAPLRENLAAGLLYALAEGSEAESVEIFDPMCGTGAFALEALSLGRPASARRFAFERLRPVLEGRWREEAPENPPGLLRFARAIGWDADERSVQAADANSGPSQASFHKQDLFEAGPLPRLELGTERWAIANPPYGERLRIEGPLTAYYAKMAERIEWVAHPDRVGLLLPAKADPSRLQWPRSWSSLGSPIALSNGGIATYFYRFKRRPRGPATKPRPPIPFDNGSGGRRRSLGAPMVDQLAGDQDHRDGGEDRQGH